MVKLVEDDMYSSFFTEYNPFFLKNMSVALERIVRAIHNREKIIIYGACNVDAICAVSILFLTLRYLKSDVEYCVSEDVEVCDQLKKEEVNGYIRPLGVSLIIAVGCSVQLDKNDIDLIVLDNKKTICEDDLLQVNPNQEGCLYKLKELSLTGVSYKLVQALSMYYDTKYVNRYIDLVYLGILSSDKPIIEENDFFEVQGLKRIEKTNNYGLKSLFKVHKISIINAFSIRDIIKTITPSVNAIGKMDDAKIIVELFITDNSYRAEQIAKYLLRKRKNNTLVDNIVEYGGI